MRDELKTFEQIDRYLNKQLSGIALLTFEQKLKDDPQFAEEVKNHQLLHELVIDQGLLELKKKMQLHDYSDRSYRFKRWSIYFGVLLMSLVTVTGWFITQSNREESKNSAPIIKEQPHSKAIEIKPDTIRQSINTQPGIRKNFETKTGNSVTMRDSVATGETSITVTPQHQQKITVHDTAKSVKLNTPLPIANIQTIKEERNALPCDLNNSMIQVQTTESCRDSPTGKIIIDTNSVIAGEGPFQFSINGKNYYSGYAFENIYAGAYTLFIKDKLGCVWNDENEITVSEKDCRTYEYSFYPSNGEKWKYPLENAVNGTLEVYSRTGSKVFSSEINNGYPDSWDGTSAGQVLPMGSYSFVLKIGNSVLTGNVTLLR